MRVFTVLGPSQSGKSTLVDALASLEEQKAQTLEVPGVARLTRFEFMDDEWAAIDIAGGSDNLASAGPALAASDAAVMCVPAEADAAVLAAPFFRLIEEAGVPCFLFINRIDVATDRVSEIVSAMQTYLQHGIVLRQVPIRDGTKITGAVDLVSERAWQYQECKPSKLVELPPDMVTREQEARTEMLESLADFDDALLEQLIEDQQPATGEVYELASKLLQAHELVPALLGAAEFSNGTFRLMKALRHEAPGYEVARERLGGDAQAVGCLADHVKHLGKTVVVRALADGVAAGAKLAGRGVGTITDIDGKTQIPSLAAGSLGMTVKTDHLKLGEAYGADGAQALPEWARSHNPAHCRIVRPVNERDEARLSAALEQLSEIDPGLQVRQDTNTGHPVICAQGVQHLRRALHKLSDGFGVEVEEDQLRPAFRETIRKPATCHHRHRKQSGGAGQFADVLIEVKPEPRGAGFTFEDQIKGGVIPRNYIPSVEAGVVEALREGPEGFPVVDLSVKLTDGKTHSVDSSDFAFKTAGKNAMKEAMAEAGTISLQPIVEVHIRVPSVFAGGLVPIVSGLRGQVLGFEGHPSAAGWDDFRTLLPEASLDELSNTLGSAARGTAWFTSEFDHYQEIRSEDLQRLTPA